MTNPLASHPFEAYKNKLLDIRSGKAKSEVIPTGLIGWDTILHGLKPGNTYIIGGRPGMGATSVLLNIMNNISVKNNISACFISGESLEESLMSRLLSIHLCKPFVQTKVAGYSDGEMDFFMKGLDRLDQAPITFINLKGEYLDEVIALMKEQIAKGVRVFFLDCIQYLTLNNQLRLTRDQEIGKIMRQLKDLMLESGAVLVAISTLSRSVETRGGDKRPMLSDLRESGSLEMLADAVVFVYRPNYYGITEDENGRPTENDLELLVARNRDGYMGMAKFHFTESTGRLSETAALDHITIKDIRTEEFG
ncbi:MAG: DnaB-like helicase C-terminal domain-containing protein [Flavobacteriales bacterium]